MPFFNYIDNMKKKLIAGASIWLSSIAVCLMFVFSKNSLKNASYNSYSYTMQPSIVFWNVSQNNNESLDKVIKQQLAFSSSLYFPNINPFYSASSSKKEYVPIIRGPLDNITSKDIIDLKGFNDFSASFKMFVLDDNIEVFGFYCSNYNVIHNVAFTNNNSIYKKHN